MYSTREVKLPQGGLTSGSASRGVWLWWWWWGGGCKFDYTQVEAISCAFQVLSSVAGELPADVCVSSKEIKHL